MVAAGADRRGRPAAVNRAAPRTAGAAGFKIVIRGGCVVCKRRRLLCPDALTWKNSVTTCHRAADENLYGFLDSELAVTLMGVGGGLFLPTSLTFYGPDPSIRRLLFIVAGVLISLRRPPRLLFYRLSREWAAYPMSPRCNCRFRRSAYVLRCRRLCLCATTLFHRAVGDDARSSCVVRLTRCQRTAGNSRSSFTKPLHCWRPVVDASRR